MANSYRFDDYGNELLPETITVSQINEYVKSLVEEEKMLQDLYVTAEISNFKLHTATGHMYFTLKDEKSEIKALMFRTYASKIKFKPENGMKVLAHARIGVYEKAGTYQLYVDSMQPDGVGSLYLAYEQLKAKLSDEGLFDEEHKRQLPKIPRRIGVITSPTGAAVRDIIKVARKRWNGVNLLIYPSAVQGSGAAEELTRGIEYFNITQSVDVIIIGRGGGSIEDLWEFNSEQLARAIYNCTIPVISAVGHEIDFTICDFVADVRAATPSHAAELATPNMSQYIELISSGKMRMYSALKSNIDNYREQLNGLKDRRVMKNPLYMFDTKKMQLSANVEKLQYTMKSKISDLKATLKQRAVGLNALNPLSVLLRGYSVAYDSENKVLKDANNVAKDDKIRVKLYNGAINATVDYVEREEK